MFGLNSIRANLPGLPSLNLDIALPQQPTKHTGPLHEALPQYDSPPTTRKDHIIDNLKGKLLGIEQSRSTIKFGNKTKNEPKANLD